MTRPKRFAVRCFLMLVIAAPTAPTEAAGPGYLILGTPSARTHQTHRHRHYNHRHYNQRQARGQTVTATAYAWGWFGARPYTHGVRHRGYYGNAWGWGQ